MEEGRIVVEEFCMPHVKILPHNLQIEVWFFKTLTGSNLFLFHRPPKDASTWALKGNVISICRLVYAPMCLSVFPQNCLLQWWKEAPNDELVLLLYIYSVACATLNNHLQKGIGTFSSCLIPKWCRDSSLETGHCDSIHFPHSYWFQKNN